MIDGYFYTTMSINIAVDLPDYHEYKYIAVYLPVWTCADVLHHTENKEKRMSE